MLVAGARRADTSYQRFRDQTFAADVSVAPSEFDPEVFDAIERLPQVAASNRPSFPFIVPAGSGLYPFLDFLAYAQPRERGAKVDVPRVLEGRLPRPDRADEMAIIERFADEASLSIGDRVSFESYAPDQFEDLFGSGDVGAPGGPRMSAIVTGIIDAPDFISEREANFLPRVFLTPAFLDQFEDSVGIYPGGISVRLHNGERDVPAFSTRSACVVAGRCRTGDPAVVRRQPAHRREHPGARGGAPPVRGQRRPRAPGGDGLRDVPAPVALADGSLDHAFARRDRARAHRCVGGRDAPRGDRWRRAQRRARVRGVDPHAGGHRA